MRPARHSHAPQRKFSATNLAVLSVYFALCAEIMLVLILSAPGRSAGSGISSALHAPPAGTARSSSRAGTGDDLFTGDFWEAGLDTRAAAPDSDSAERSAPADEDTGILEPASPDNPRNPATGERFTDKQMLRFEELNRRFVGNTLVPRRRKDVRAAMETEAQIIALERQAQGGTATVEQIEAVHEYYIRREEANIRLLEYLKEFAETDAQRARQRWLQKRSRTAIEQRVRQRERLLKLREEG